MPAILHADLDSFYASVEVRDAPELAGRPVLVGPGIVLAATYPAKARGVRTAMPVRRALALCPDAVVVPARFEAYVAASREVFEIFDETTPYVEPISIDEAFLDVGGLGRSVGTPAEIARRLRHRVRTEVGLPISVGISAVKFVAKVASAASKPDGLLEVPPGREREFLHPLPIERLWGVGAVTSAKLHALGVTTIGQLATIDLPTLTSVVGSGAAHHLSSLAQVRDPRPVELGRRRSSIGAQAALGPAVRAIPQLDATLLSLVDRIARRLRGVHRAGRTVTLRLRFGDMARATRSHTLPLATDRTEELLAAARELLDQARPLVAERGLTLIGVSVSGLTDAASPQLEFELDSADAPAPQRRRAVRNPALDKAIDAARAKFGTAAVSRATLLGRTPDLTLPILPDR